MMLKISSLSLALVLTVGLAADSHAYVVIGNFEADADDLSNANDSNDEEQKATGVVSKDPGRDIADRDFSFQPRNVANGGNRGGGDRSQGSQLLRYSSSSSRGTSGGGGGGGGGRGGRSGRVRGAEQDIVPVNNVRRERETEPADVDGLDVGLSEFSDDSMAGGSSGGASAPGGSSDEPPIYRDSSGPSGSVVTGTPEPAAVVIWAIAGGCGYGLVSLRKRWFPLD